jgi:hypothetical protein
MLERDRTGKSKGGTNRLETVFGLQTTRAENWGSGCQQFLCFADFGGQAETKKKHWCDDDDVRQRSAGPRKHKKHQAQLFFTTVTLSQALTGLSCM